MTDYTELENLSDEDILNTYDDVILMSSDQFHCLCKCEDGYEVNYTCINTAFCPDSQYNDDGYRNKCSNTLCTNHGGMNVLINRPDSGDVCCSSGSSCWRYTITTW